MCSLAVEFAAGGREVGVRLSAPRLKMKQKKAAISWTGGKDSSLALFEAKKLNYDIVCLVTFAPKNAKFLAHPLEIMKLQAKALSLPHYILEITEPVKESYETALQHLKDEHAIETIITGDIAEVEGLPNWLKECSKKAGLKVTTPLWGKDRNELITKLLELKFKVIFSCVKKPWFTPDWIGTELTNETFNKLQTLHQQTGLDICGENGEYHTLVLDSPLYKQQIKINSSKNQIKDKLMYLDIQKVNLEEKN